MRIALAQIDLAANVESNLNTILQTIDAAAHDKADIVLFPECALTGYLGFGRNTLADLDPQQVHDAIMQVQGHCAQRRIGAVVGQYFKRCGRWYNNAVALGRDGKLLASYDKCQLVDRDCYEVAPGQALSTFAFDDALCSLAICHDIRYPEVLRHYGAAGVQVHFHLFYGFRPPGLSAEHYQEQYDAHLVTRAVENGFFLAAANAAHDEQMVRSQCRDREGRCLASATSWRSQLTVVEVNPREAGDGWAQKRRQDLFDPTGAQRSSSYFERGVWEHKQYMIRADESMITTADALPETLRRQRL